METGPRAQVQRAACRRCHLRKVKCNGQPCSRCQAASVECVPYDKRRRNRGPPRDTSLPLPSLLPAHEAHNSHEERPQSEKAPQSPHGEPKTWDLSPAETPRSDAGPSPHVHRRDEVKDDRDEVDQAAATLSSLQYAESKMDVEKHLVEMLSQDDIDRRIIQKGVRIVYVGQEFSNIHYLVRHRSRKETVHHFPANHISRQYTCHHLDRIPKEAFELPEREVVDELLENYFKLINPGFPILDEEVFMRQYRACDPKDPPSLLVLQAVLLVGAHVSRRRPDRDALKADFFRRAKMLFDARFEYNRDVVVQAALLMMWHSEGVEDVGANSYHWVSFAARTAFGLGMHRDCSPSTLVAQDRRIWRRVWWILVQFDVLVALSYGRPQAINLDDADVSKLTLQDFDGLDGNVDAEFVIHQSQLCAIISGILRERWGLRVPEKRRADALLDADNKLVQWKADLPPNLRPAPPGSVLSLWPALLHINYNNFLILLHRPPPRPDCILNNGDLGMCSLAASDLTDLFETILRREELFRVNVFVVNALFTTLIQLSAEMRIGNPVVRDNAMGKFDTGLEVLRSLSEYWLNAEIIQRLFEDSSEGLQQELQIGKGTAQSTPFADSAVGTEDGLSPAWAYVTEIQAEASNRAGDWNSLYWENSGFNYMDSFGDFGLYQTT